MRHPPGIDRAPGSAHHPPQFIGQLLEDGEVGGSHHAAAAGDDELGARHVHMVQPLLVADDLEHLGEDVLLGNGTADAEQLPGGSFAALGKRHHVGADGGHLGAELVAHDGGHDVAAKGGSGLHQVSLAIHGQPGAIGGKSCADHCGDGPGQVTAYSCGPHEDDLGPVHVDQLAERLQVSLGAVMPEDRGIDEIGLVGAIGEGLMAKRFHILAQHHRGEFHADGVGQLPPLAEEFPRHPGRLPFGLLDEDPDAAVGGELGRQRARLGIVLHQVRSRRLVQLIEKLLLLGREEHADGLGRADLDALDAADALLGEDERPASFMATASTGQELSQRAPQAMHFPSMTRALPRGFLIGFSVMLFTPRSISATFAVQPATPAIGPYSAASRSGPSRSLSGRATRRRRSRPSPARGRRSCSPRWASP